METKLFGAGSLIGGGSSIGDGFGGSSIGGGFCGSLGGGGGSFTGDGVTSTVSVFLRCCSVIYAQDASVEFVPLPHLPALRWMSPMGPREYLCVAPALECASKKRLVGDSLAHIKSRQFRSLSDCDDHDGTKPHRR